MIKSFGDGDTEKLWRGERVTRFQAIEKQARKRLRVLDAAESREVLMLIPGNRFHALGGDLKDFDAIRVNDQYRVIFRFRDGDAHDVQVIDYHK